MNTAELIYQDLQTFPEWLTLEVFDFVEFLKAKNQALLEQEQDTRIKIQIGIEQADAGLGIPLNKDYAKRLNQRILESLEKEGIAHGNV